MNKVKAFLAELPNRLDAMDYEKISDEEYERVKKADVESYHNARLEGIFLSDEENYFFQTLLEKRVPKDLRKLFSDEYIQIRFRDYNG